MYLRINTLTTFFKSSSWIMLTLLSCCIWEAIWYLPKWAVALCWCLHGPYSGTVDSTHFCPPHFCNIRGASNCFWGGSVNESEFLFTFIIISVIKTRSHRKSMGSNNIIILLCTTFYIHVVEHYHLISLPRKLGHTQPVMAILSSAYLKQRIHWFEIMHLSQSCHCLQWPFPVQTHFS